MTRLPVYQRRPGQVSGQLVERDVEILRLLQTYRYLQTGQIHQLLWPGKSIQPARKRLRFLFHHGYVNKMPMLVKPGRGGTEDAFFLDRLGYDTIDPERRLRRRYQK